MLGWYHQLGAYEFEQTLGGREGQGSRVCCSPWDCEESDFVTEQEEADLQCFVLVSGAQQSESLIHVHTSALL